MHKSIHHSTQTIGHSLTEKRFHVTRFMDPAKLKKQDIKIGIFDSGLEGKPWTEECINTAHPKSTNRRFLQSCLYLIDLAVKLAA